MPRVSAIPLWSAVILAVAAGGCATVVVPCVPPCRPPMASSLTELRLAQGTQVVVELVGGETVRGVVKDMRPAELEVLARNSGAQARRTITEPEIRTIGRVVGMTKRKRRWLGAAVGALASLPFSISMFGDMVVPGAIAGALFGSGSGNLREEIIFERRVPYY